MVVLMIYCLSLDGNQTTETLKPFIMEALDMLYDNLYEIKDKDIKKLYELTLIKIYKQNYKK